MTNEKLQELKAAIDLVRRLIALDVYYAIYDEICVVQYIYPEDGEQDGIYVGRVFHDPTGKLQEAIETDKCIHNYLPMEKLGVIMEGNIVPVHENGKVCGAVSSAYMPLNQQQMNARELAMQSIYSLILSVDANRNLYTKIHFNNEMYDFPMESQHFDDLCQKTLEDVHPEDRDTFRLFTNMTHICEELREKDTISMECRLHRGNAEYEWRELIIKRILNFENADKSENFLYMVRDIHERKSKEEEVLKENRELIAQLRINNQTLFEQSMVDELTGLYNRKGLQYFSNSVLQSARKNGLYIYTFVADMNGLKFINDKFGHEEGDFAIQKMAKLLKSCAPTSATIIRSGGDEFFILAVLEANSTLPQKTEKRFLEKVKEFNSNSGLAYNVEAAYGWDFRSVAEIETIDECIGYADRKMYKMKSKRKVPGRFTERAQNEMFRRFGSAKQEVFIFSMNNSVQKDIAGFFDDNYIVSTFESAEALVQRLREIQDVVLLFIDNHHPKFSGMDFIQALPEALQNKSIMILLTETEEDEVIRKAFALGVDDVLSKPYNTVINKCHMTHLFRMNVANRRMSRMMENREIKG